MTRTEKSWARGRAVGKGYLDWLTQRKIALLQFLFNFQNIVNELIQEHKATATTTRATNVADLLQVVSSGFTSKPEKGSGAIKGSKVADWMTYWGDISRLWHANRKWQSFRLRSTNCATVTPLPLRLPLPPSPCLATWLSVAQIQLLSSFWVFWQFHEFAYVMRKNVRWKCGWECGTTNATSVSK